MEILILWIIFTILVVGYAGRRGRSRFIAFVLSLLLSPIIGLLIYAVLGESRRGLERRILKEERLRMDARRSLAGIKS